MSSNDLGPADSANGAGTRYVPPSRRRDKPQIVCNSCRKRKLKCDRGRPCDNCTRRGLSNSCTYVANASSEPIKRTEPYAGVQDRIVQLENLVTTLMNSKSGVGKATSATKISAGGTIVPGILPSAASSADASQLSESFGHIKLENGESSYADTNHWRAVLDEISELKDHIEDTNESPEDSGPIMGREDDVADSLLGYHEPATKQEILDTMPARQTVDRLLSVYFNQANMAPGTFVVHCPTFLKRYEAFWLDPHGTDTLWIGQLYGMICLATAYQQYSGQDSDSQSRHLIPKYRTKLIQCLVLGQYTKCGAGTLETLLLYQQVEYLRSTDLETEVWVILGIIVRLALRMGYHRDPSHGSKITPFEGEMRRRCWAVIWQFDVVTAAQFGLPRMIRDVQMDTKPPRNLNDSDIYEDMKELPPARPESDHTIIQFWTQKSKLVRLFGKVCELHASVYPFPYTEVLDLDKQLLEAKDSIPEFCFTKSMSQSILDPPELIMGRSFMEVLFQKTRVVLHRKYMFAGKTNQAYAYSRVTAIESALDVLRNQAILDSETQPGGRLHDHRWKLGSIIKHEFLLATTILCLYLNQEATATPSASQPDNDADIALRERVIRRLSSAYLIWFRISESSDDSKKAVVALRLVLGKAQKLCFPGYEAVAEALNTARWQATLNKRDHMPTLFTPPSSNVSSGEDSNQQSPEAMEVTDLPVVDSAAMIDPGAGADLFDMDTWDLGDFNDGMDGFYDMGQQLTMPGY